MPRVFFCYSKRYVRHRTYRGIVGLSAAVTAMAFDNFLDFLEQQEPELVTTALAMAATDSDDAAMKQVGIDVAEFRKRSDRIAMIRAAFLRNKEFPPRSL